MVVVRESQMVVDISVIHLVSMFGVMALKQITQWKVLKLYVMHLDVQRMLGHPLACLMLK
jgi:hypothetical protein